MEVATQSVVMQWVHDESTLSTSIPSHLNRYSTRGGRYFIIVHRMGEPGCETPPSDFGQQENTSSACCSSLAVIHGRGRFFSWSFTHELGTLISSLGVCTLQDWFKFEALVVDQPTSEL